MAEIDQMHCSGEKEFKSRQCILTISLSSPLVEQCAPSFDFNKFESPFTQGCFVPRLTEIDQVILEKKDFWLKLTQWFWRKNYYFSTCIFIKNKLESLHPRTFCAKFGWDWFSGSGEEVYRHTDRRRTSGYWFFSSDELNMSTPCTSFFDAMFKKRGPFNFHMWENVFFHMVAYLCPLHAR